MTPDDPRHGTYAEEIRHGKDGEKDCAPCTLARARSSKQMRVDRARGNSRMVTLGNEAWAVIDSWPRDQLARATGLYVHNLCRFHTAGPDKHVLRRTRDKILTAATSDYWTPIGIQRRLRALHAIGWSMRALALEVGEEHPTSLLNLVRREQPKFVRRPFALMILDAYERLCMTPRTGSGATRARNTARRNGWAAPLDWDDIDRDEQPVATVHRITWPSDELVAEWDHLRRLGLTLNEVAERLGITAAAIEMAVRRTREAEVAA
jgi:hypothetical protein